MVYFVMREGRRGTGREGGRGWKEGRTRQDRREREGMREGRKQE